ncbi:PilN domain-containing protein [Patescibacteria group bacterium]
MINLLPPDYKKEMAAEETKRLVMILGVLVFFSILSFTLALLAVKIYLSGQFDSQQVFLEIEKEKAVLKEIEDLEKKVEVFNEKLSRVDDFYNQRVSLAGTLNKVIDTIPEEIYLTGLVYTKEAGVFTVSGFSPFRDILEDFKANLERNFYQVTFLRETWNRPRDIDFKGVQFHISQ